MLFYNYSVYIPHWNVCCCTIDYIVYYTRLRKINIQKALLLLLLRRRKTDYMCQNVISNPGYSQLHNTHWIHNLYVIMFRIYFSPLYCQHYKCVGHSEEQKNNTITQMIVMICLYIFKTTIKRFLTSFFWLFTSETFNFQWQVVFYL